MSYWVIHYTPLTDNNKTKLLDLPVGSVVNLTGNYYDGYSEVTFITRLKTWTGWVRKEYLEEIVYEYPSENVFPVSAQTPYPYDAAQYIVAYGGTLYNLCGEGCVAWIFHNNIIEFLSAWQAKPVSFFNRIIYNGKSLTTSIADLKNMVTTYGEITWDFADKIDTVSPGNFKKVLEDGYKCIVGCSISGSGYLQSSGIRHWIVVSNVTPDGIDNGWVEIYNPFFDRKERYAWRNFKQSIGNPCGIFVKG